MSIKLNRSCTLVSSFHFSVVVVAIIESVGCEVNFPEKNSEKLILKPLKSLFFVSRHNLRTKNNVSCQSHVKGLGVNLQPSRAICYLGTCPNADWLSIIGFQVGGVIQQTVNCTQKVRWQPNLLAANFSFRFAVQYSVLSFLYFKKIVWNQRKKCLR